MPRSTAGCVLIGAMCVLLSNARAADLHVAPNGRDAWSGRLEQPKADASDGPLATLTAARDAARRTQEPGRPRKIIVHAGVYPLEHPLVLEPADSGLTVEAAGEVVLRGGRPITGWKRDRGELWSADVPEVKAGTWDFRLLIVNGRSARRARWPQTGFFEHLTRFDVPWMSTTGGGWQRKPTHDELTHLVYKPGDLGSWLDLRNAELMIYHSWDESVVGLAAHDAERNLLVFKNEAGHPPGAFGNQRYVLWNVAEGLKEPGQWYLDRSAGKVIYWPLPGEDMAHVEVLAPVTESIIRLAGRKDEPIREVILRGLSLQLTSTPLVAGGFGAGEFDGAVAAQGTRNCRLERLAISNVGGQGIKAKDAERLVVAECHVHHTGAGGILLLDGRQCRIENNLVQHVGLTYPSAIGVWFGGQSFQVRHNEVSDTSYSAMDASGDDHLIEANRFRRPMQQLVDGACIYVTFCKRITIRGNLATEIGNAGPAHAYYLDEQAEDCVVEGNVSEDIAWPWHNHMARRCTLRNNIAIHDGDVRITFPRCTDFVIEHNVIVSRGTIRVEASDEAIRSMPGNVFFSQAGRVEHATLKDYTGQDTSPLEPHDGTVLADPRLRHEQPGVYTFGPDSPAAKAGVKTVDVHDAGPQTSH